MSKVNDLLVAESEKYVSALLTEKLPDTFIFHTRDHLMRVRKYAETIGGHEGLSKEEMNILRISALFHNTGYVNSFKLCKEESVKIATDFLEGQGVDRQTIDHVAGTIRSTGMPQGPRDRIAEVLCDADMMYITADDGLEQFDLLYDETALQNHKFGKRSAYERGCTGFFASHTYFTEYGKTVLQPKKEAATQRLLNRMSRRKLIDNKKLTSSKGELSYSRGVETLFRLTARNQINLNSIADNKSNILISVNAIIISIIITMLAGNIGNMTMGLIPILTFLVSCLVTVTIAILSTRPNIITSRFTQEDIENKAVDLIFFGNFVKMDYDEYLKAVKEMMKDDEHLYSTMIKNQYSLGKILSKKFRLVRIAYNLFMIGIILTVIVFLVNLLFAQQII